MDLSVLEDSTVIEIILCLAKIKWEFLSIKFDEYYRFLEINSQGEIKKEFWSFD